MQRSRSHRKQMNGMEQKKVTLKRNNRKKSALLIHPCNWIRLVLLHFHRNFIICMDTFLLKESDCNGFIAHRIDECLCMCD